MAATSHISVCICTYKRPRLLRRLLNELLAQETGSLFTFSVVVVDNDAARSAEPVVTEFAARTLIPIGYYVELEQSIARARNKAVAQATGDLISFIDDDEYPVKDWLLTLVTEMKNRGADGVLGPVKPDFDQSAPKWVIRGKFYERETYPTGHIIDWRQGRTGNVLLRRDLLVQSAEPFDPEFRTGEDQEFFHRAINSGAKFIWCNEAVAYEAVPPIRWKRSFMLRRALLRGSMEPKTPDFGVGSVVKSLVAVGVYAVALPFAALLGHHKFMSLLIRICDHGGKLIAAIGINPIRESYVVK